MPDKYEIHERIEEATPKHEVCRNDPDGYGTVIALFWKKHDAEEYVRLKNEQTKEKP